MNGIDTILILGGHIQALGLVRQAKRKGVRVILALSDGFSVARFSRFVDDLFICKKEEDLISRLETKGNKTTMLFPTSDEYIAFISRHYEKLIELYTIALPNLSTVRLFADKSFAYRFAEKNGIPHPWCRYPQNVSEVRELAEALGYPVIIKPSVMYSFHKKFGKKAFLCEDKESLLAKVDEIYSVGFPINSLIIQEYLSGGAKYLYSYGFFSVSGEVKSSIMVNRIRQNPMDFGNSTTFAVTVDIPEIADEAKRIIKLTGYTGMGEVEFMLDKGKFKFLEINTRAWKWHTITNGLGFSFIGDWIDWLNLGRISDRKDCQGNCAWVERLTDFAVIVKGFIYGKVKMREAIQSYRHKKISAVWDVRDPLPSLMYLLMSPILYVKRF